VSYLTPPLGHVGAASEPRGAAHCRAAATGRSGARRDGWRSSTHEVMQRIVDVEEFPLTGVLGEVRSSSSA